MTLPHGRVAIFEAILARWQPGRLLDLGAGHGKFSLAAQRLGWEVTAVDARTDRMPGTPGIEWVQSDVRSFGDGKLSDWDCIAILGLLYHLALPDVLRLLQRCCPTPTIVDTHVARGGWWRQRRLTAQHGYQGRLFHEELEAPTAAYGNPESFWPTEDSLIRIFRDCGYETTLKLVPSYRPDRTFWVCT
jgi:2-polyprenyl-3-methyl-5-hydroxy-6-metoxy-1,4-benzoquinol methylase